MAAAAGSIEATAVDAPTPRPRRARRVLRLLAESGLDAADDKGRLLLFMFASPSFFGSLAHAGQSRRFYPCCQSGFSWSTLDDFPYCHFRVASMTAIAERGAR